MRHPLLQKYDRLIEFFGQMLGQDYELSLFDLRAEGCPLIFIAGGLNSGRPLGTPLAAAGLSMLERFRQGDREPLVNSHSVTADGRLLLLGGHPCRRRRRAGGSAERALRRQPLPRSGR